MNTNFRNPTKKRKVDDGRADVSHHDGHFLHTWLGYFFSGRRNDTLPQLDRMEQMMMRMEDKLGTISSLESRCEELEAKCSSLENKLDSTLQAVKDHTDQKFESMTSTMKDYLNDKIEVYHEYNSMLVKNQSWKYSADIPPIDQIMSDTDCDYHTAVNVTKTIQRMKENTIKMRRGEFTSEEEKEKSISLDNYNVHDHKFCSVIRPHLEEFAKALKQFTPVMNLSSNECDTTFRLLYIISDHSGRMMMKNALIGKPFTSMHFCHDLNVEGDYEGMTANDIVTIAESNKHLRKLEIFESSIHDDITNRLCSIVHNHSLLDLRITNSIREPGVGNAILVNLFTNVELKLECLSMKSAGITSEVSTVLASFLAANPALRFLDLDENSLKDSDAALLANALRSNTTLHSVSLSENNITKNGFELFRPVLCNESSLNAVADSNHNCYIFDFHNDVNCTNAIKTNRGLKIYSILSSRHISQSNVQYLSNVDMNLLPNMLEAVQSYAKIVTDFFEYDDYDDLKDEVEGLSIVYEIMRRWEKVFNLYEG